MRHAHNQLAMFEQPTAPGAKALTMQPRYYQRDADAATVASLRDNDSALVVMATGLGKSICFSLRAAAAKGRVLFLAHRDELLQQAMGHLQRATGGAPIELEQAGFRAGRGQYVVASIQTIHRDDRLQRFRPADFELVIVDEAHRSVTATYKKALDHFMGGGCKVVGYTATPRRHDEKALGKRFDDVAYTMGIGDGVKDGWLVRPRARAVQIESIQLERVSTTAGDFAAGSLDEEMAKSIDAIVDKTLELEPDRTAIGAFAGRHSAQYACEVFNARRPGSAIYIDGETNKDERRYLVDGFRRGDYQYLCQVGIAIEGFDAPVADMIIQCRPTKSEALYTQLIGRATRPAAGILDPFPEKHQRQERANAIKASNKPDMLILDFVGTSDYHKLKVVTAAAALGGDFEDDVVQRAKKLSDDKPGEDVLDLLEEAKASLEEERSRMHRRAAAFRAKVTAHIRDIDPFDELGIDKDALTHTDQRYGAKPATKGQLEALKNFGVEDADKLSKRKATALLGKMIERIETGKASLKQIAIIRRHVPCTEELSRYRANLALDYLSQNQWGRGRRFDAKKLHNIINAPRQPGEEG